MYIAYDMHMIIENVTVIDGTGNAPQPGMDVHVTGGRFADIRPTGMDESRTADDGGVVDGRGGYLIPGLWETHTHVAGPGIPGSEVTAHIRKTLATYFPAGVTAVCDLGSLYQLKRGERETLRADGTAPALFCTRPGFTGVKGWPANSWDGSRMPELEAVDGLDTGGVRQVDNADLARWHLLRSLDDVDYVKCFLDSATGSGGRLPLDALEAIVATAHDADKKVIVHIATGADLKDAARAGADCIEHSPIPRDPADPGEAEELAEVLAECGTLYCPTIVTWEQLARNGDLAYLDELVADGIATPEDVAEITARPEYGRPFPHHPAEEMQVRFEYAMRTLHVFHAAGVKLVAGSDIWPVMPTAGHALLRELQLFAKAGLPCAEIIATATRRAAEKAGKAGSMGTITVGSAADAVLLDADPLTDIAHVTDAHHRRAVISAGHLVHRITE